MEHSLSTAESRLREQIQAVRAGRLSRRDFVQRLGAAGLSAPMAGLLLMHAGVAPAQAASAFVPTKRGGGGTLKMLLWQGPTLLNPQFANGTKDGMAARLFYEPLVHWDGDGNLVPILAAELPSRDNGGLAADGRSVLWTLKKGVTWHDGKPFTAADVVFTWKYVIDPATAAVTFGAYQGVALEAVGSHQVRVVFDKPTPFWPGVYSTIRILPRHLFEPYIGAKSRDAPANLKPVGTGPYRFVEFRPGDLLRAELNPTYHQPNKPYFDTIDLKGGGDAVSAARAVLQTGEFDYAWNLQVDDEVLKRMVASGKGRVVFLEGGAVESMYLNYADPNTEVDGERASPKSRHPLFSDDAVRRAIGLLADRASVQQYIYGRAGVATANYLVNPARFRSPNMKAVFSVEQANALLDAAGWKRDGDGIRSKGGRRLQLVFQTSTNPLRQKTQSLFKQAARKAGIEVEIKGVSASVFFSSDVGNPDTMGKFWADIQMFTQSMGLPDPQGYMRTFVSSLVASKANKWASANFTRWQNTEYDQAHRAAEDELDPVKRAALFIRMNDLLCGDGYVVPLVYRPSVNAVAGDLVAPMTDWDDPTGLVQDWHRQA